MPIYEFFCLNCQERFGELCGFSTKRDGELACPNCGSEHITRLFSVFFSRGRYKETFQSQWKGD